MINQDVREIYSQGGKIIGSEVSVAGWVRTVRVSKEVIFLELHDGTDFRSLQIVLGTAIDNLEEIKNLPISSAIEVSGVIVKSQGTGQSIELEARVIKILAKSGSDYPIQKKKHSLEFLRTVAHLRPRTNTFQAVFRVRSILSFAIHKFFQERGFVYLHSPIITASDCEGAGEMFNVTNLDVASIKKETGKDIFKSDFFGKKAHLTVSGQLNAEAAMAFKRVYTFGPTFRAENSNTARHAAEFWMIEPEIAFANLVDDIRLAEDMIKYIIKEVLEKCLEEMNFFEERIESGLKERLEELIRSEFKHLEYTEAIKILEESGKKFAYPVKWGIDLQTEHERYLTDEVFKCPIFVINYPKEIKAFYMRLNSDEKTVAAMDLLVPGIGEIIGGSQREERLDLLEKRMKEVGLKINEYEWYLDPRRYGGVEHAGFGLGLERVIMYITGMKNIRDVLPFSRVSGSINF